MPSKKIYWDSCVFLSVLQENPKRLTDLNKILAEAEHGRLIIVTSAATLAEVAYIDDLAKDSKAEANKQVDTIGKLFLHEYFEIWNVDRHIAEEAARFAREYGVSPYDGIQVATTIATRCPCLYTYDGDNVKRKRKKGKLLPLDGKILLPNKQFLRIETPEKFLSSSSHSQPLFAALPE